MQPFRKQLLVATIVAAALMFIGLLLMGIPGAILLEIPSWLGLAKGIEGDAAWPAAILVSFVWPLVIPLGVIVKHLLSTRASMAVAQASLWVTIVAGMVLVVTFVHWLYRFG